MTKLEIGVVGAAVLLFVANMFFLGAVPLYYLSILVVVAASIPGCVRWEQARRQRSSR